MPDLVGNLLPACNGLKEKAVGLKHIMSADGVHFTKHGYEKLAETVVKCCKTQFEKSVSAASIVSARPAGTRQKTFYWRGFVSPVGSSRPASRTAAYLAAHPGGGGKWRNKSVNTGKNADKKQGGRNPPPVLSQKLVNLLTTSGPGFPQKLFHNFKNAIYFIA